MPTTTRNDDRSESVGHDQAEIGVRPARLGVEAHQGAGRAGESWLVVGLEGAVLERGGDGFRRNLERHGAWRRHRVGLPRGLSSIGWVERGLISAIGGLPRGSDMQATQLAY